MRRYLALALVAAACKVEGGDVAPLQAGNGIVVGDKNLVSVDASRVPVLPSCEGGFLSKQADGWKCIQVDASDIHGLADQLAAKLGKDEAASTYLKTADADAKFALDADLQGLEAAVYTKAAADAAFATKASLDAAVADADARFATKTALQDHYTKTEADGLFALKTHTHSLADLGAASAADLGALTTKVEDRTKSVSQSSVLNLGCVTASHGWNTRAVGFSAWYADAASPGTLLPATPAYEPGVTNLGLARRVVASSTVDAVRLPENAVDGDPSTYWTGNDTTSSLAVDLGTARAIGAVAVNPGFQDATTACGTTSWDVSTSADGVGFTVVWSGTCTQGVDCARRIVQPLATVSWGRWVRFTSKASNTTNAPACYGNARLNEFEVYGASPVTMPDADKVRFCNYTGSTRDLALTVWH